MLEEDVSAGEMRHRGFLDACRECGVEVPEDAQELAEFTVDSGYSCAEAIMQARPHTDARNRATFPFGYARDGERRYATVRIKRSATASGTSWVIDKLEVDEPEGSAE